MIFMQWKKYMLSARFLCVFLLSIGSLLYPLARFQGVTTQSANTRFGDALLNYMHAKWISYRYEIPFYYAPFIYSNLLLLDAAEQCLNKKLKKILSKRILGVNGLDTIEQNSYQNKILFSVSYFPECNWELKKYPYSNYFPVDWDDTNFISLLRAFIQPKHPIPKLDLPKDRVTIALHVRRGGGYDDKFWLDALPLKFPPDSYYIKQVREIHRLVNYQPLYIYIFTDDQDPQSIAKKYQDQLTDVEAVFAFRSQGNRHDANVLEDFFNMMEFDCLIRAESNYSFIVGRLGNFKIEINPEDFVVVNEEIIISETDTKIKDI